MTSNTWIVKAEDDGEGGLWLPLPADLLSQMGWSEGTELFWHVKDGKWMIMEKNDGTSKAQRPDTDDAV